MFLSKVAQIDKYAILTYAMGFIIYSDSATVPSANAVKPPGT